MNNNSSRPHLFERCRKFNVHDVLSVEKEESTPQLKKSLACLRASSLEPHHQAPPNPRCARASTLPPMEPISRISSLLETGPSSSSPQILYSVAKLRVKTDVVHSSRTHSRCCPICQECRLAHDGEDAASGSHQEVTR